MFRSRTDVADDDTAYEDTARPIHTWSPAQFIAFVIGAAAVVLGAIALTRTGFHPHRLYDHERTVLSFSHSQLLALVEIGFGVLMMVAALSPGGRGLMTLLSAALLGFGIVVVADWWQADLGYWLGVHDRNGWLFIIVGAVGLFSALFLPTFRTGGVSRRRTLIHH
jgi:hypothetical protein